MPLSYNGGEAVALTAMNTAAPRLTTRFAQVFGAPVAAAMATRNFRNFVGSQPC